MITVPTAVQEWRLKKLTSERIYEKDGALLKPKEEIIRCKDCRFQGKPLDDEITPCGHFRGLMNAKDENFCPYGKRKESEEE